MEDFMKNAKKWLSLLLTGTLLVSALAGCGDQNQTSTPKDENAGPVVVEDVRRYLVDDTKSVDINRDRTRITYEYDYYGTITKATYQDLWNGGDPRVIFEADIEYDAKGRPTRVEAPVGYYYIYSYDNRDQLVNVKVYWDAVVSDPTDDYVKMEYSRAEKGEYPYLVKVWGEEGAYTLEYYNEQHQLMKKEGYKADATLLWRETFQYNQQGNLISKFHKNMVESNSDSDHENTYADSDYDKFGNCYVKWHWTTDKKDESHLFAYFNLDGGVTQMRKYFESNDTSRYDAYEYDANGQLMKMQDYIPGGYEESVYHPYVVWGDGLLNLFLQTRPNAMLVLDGQY